MRLRAPVLSSPEKVKELSQLVTELQVQVRDHCFGLTSPLDYQYKQLSASVNTRTVRKKQTACRLSMDIFHKHTTIEIPHIYLSLFLSTTCTEPPNPVPSLNHVILNQTIYGNITWF